MSENHQYGAPQNGAPQGGPAGYAAPTGAPQPGAPGTPPPDWDIGADLSAVAKWTWAAFSRNLAAFLVPGIVYGVIVIGIAITMAVAMFAGMISTMSTTTSDPESIPSPVGMLLGLGAYVLLIPVVLIVGILWSSGANRAAAIIRDGGRPTIGQGFVGSGRVVATSLVCQVTIVVGTMLCYAPGIIASVVLAFAIPAAAAGASMGDAIRRSYELARDNLALTIVAMLLLGVAVGVLGMLVVTYVLLPSLSALLMTAVYERASRRELRDPVRG